MELHQVPGGQGREGAAAVLPRFAVRAGHGTSVGCWPKHPLDVILSQNGPQKRVLRRKLGLETVSAFVRFGKICIVRSLSPYGVLNSGHKLTVTYYWEITIEPILNPEFDVDHDFEVKNGCFQSLFPRFRVISACSTGRASHSDHFSGQVSMATILQDFYLFRRGFQHRVRDHLPDEG